VTGDGWEDAAGGRIIFAFFSFFGWGGEFGVVLVVSGPSEVPRRRRFADRDFFWPGWAASLVTSGMDTVLTSPSSLADS
jgi:hypothetical protein